jgi:hypothetical protein
MNKTTSVSPKSRMRFQPLVVLSVTMFEEETTLSYTLSDDGYIKVYDSLLGKYIDSEGFKRTNKPIREDLREILKAYFQRMRYFSGLPTYIQSPLLTPSAFNNLFDEIRQETVLIAEKTKANKTAIIYFLEEQELQPVPSAQLYQWYSRCPNAIGFITL